MNIYQIDYSYLTEEQMDRADALMNETLPQGQSFFLEIGNSNVLVIENDKRAWFELQNRDAIKSRNIQEILRM